MASHWASTKIPTPGHDSQALTPHTHFPILSLRSQSCRHTVFLWFLQNTKSILASRFSMCLMERGCLRCPHVCLGIWAEVSAQIPRPLGPQRDRCETFHKKPVSSPGWLPSCQCELLGAGNVSLFPSPLCLAPKRASAHTEWTLGC